MQKTVFVFHHASILERAIAWGLVIVLAAAVAMVLHRYAKWPWLLSLPAGVLSYVIIALVVNCGRLAMAWWFRH